MHSTAQSLCFPFLAHFQAVDAHDAWFCKVLTPASILENMHSSVSFVVLNVSYAFTHLVWCAYGKCIFCFHWRCSRIANPGSGAYLSRPSCLDKGQNNPRNFVLAQQSSSSIPAAKELSPPKEFMPQVEAVIASTERNNTSMEKVKDVH